MFCKCGHEIPFQLGCCVDAQSVTSPAASLHAPAGAVPRGPVEWAFQHLIDVCVQAIVLYCFLFQQTLLYPPTLFPSCLRWYVALLNPKSLTSLEL